MCGLHVNGVCVCLCVSGCVRYCAVLCCAVLCCAVLCCAVLCCAVLCCAVLCVQGWNQCAADVQKSAKTVAAFVAFSNELDKAQMSLQEWLTHIRQQV